MLFRLTDGQLEARAACRDFVEAEIAPRADEWDREERIPPPELERFVARGYLGAALPAEHGGGGADMVTYGLLCEEVGRGCSSMRSLMTVHGMVALAILRWGGRELRSRWLGRLAAGETLAAFALTEPGAGSDAAAVETSAEASGDHYVLNGRKRWVTFGQVAGLFLVFAQAAGRSAAFLVERGTPGLTVEPLRGVLGTRASMLAELRLENCRVHRSALVGREGFGFSHVAGAALDFGRYTVAWGCVGIGQACLDASLSYAGGRRQFGSPLNEHQLIQRMLSDMIAGVKAARLLCLHAGHLRDVRDPAALVETNVAKYYASTLAARAADDAVQIHGANGCGADYPVQRFLRDARVMQIIEGSTQIQQINIARHAAHGRAL